MVKPSSVWLEKRRDASLFAALAAAQAAVDPALGEGPAEIQIQGIAAQAQFAAVAAEIGIEAVMGIGQPEHPIEAYTLVNAEHEGRGIVAVAAFEGVDWRFPSPRVTVAKQPDAAAQHHCPRPVGQTG